MSNKAGDTISRQDAIKIASGHCHPANIAKELAALPSAQQWIPCSERLPEERGRYLVTGTTHFVPDHVDDPDYIDDDVRIDYFDVEFGWWNIGEKNTAWMTLPEPYKVEV